MNFSHLQRNSICIYGNVCLSDISQLLKLDISNCQAIPTNATIVETFVMDTSRVHHYSRSKQDIAVIPFSLEIILLKTIQIGDRFCESSMMS